MFQVVIVSWNVKSLLQRCLAALLQERQAGAKIMVTVVDNASNDGSAELVRLQFPEVKLMACSRNLGFAAACNMGAQGTTADYLVFLNPDTQVTAGFFSDLERTFIHHPEVAVVGGHILNEDGTTQPSVRAFPTLWVGLLEAGKLLGRCPALAKRYLQSDFDYAVSQPVAQVMGACLAVRTKVWQELNGFDESFFLWFEEVDFCRRVHAAGYQVWYESGLVLVHSGGQSFSQLTYSERHLFYLRSLTRYLRKHVGFISAALVWLISWPVFGIIYLYDRVFTKHAN